MTPAKKLMLLFGACSVAAAGLLGREGWETKTYPDPVHGWAVPTACAGVTGEGVVRGKTYTEDECIALTGQAMFKHAAPLLPCIRGDFPVTDRGQSYLGEMVSLSHNIGTGGFLGSGMCREMKAGNYKAACDSILLWRKAGGVDCSDPNQRVCRGLWIDRQRQHAQCLQTIPAS